MFKLESSTLEKKTRFFKHLTNMVCFVNVQWVATSVFFNFDINIKYF